MRFTIPVHLHCDAQQLRAMIAGDAASAGEPCDHTAAAQVTLIQAADSRAMVPVALELPDASHWQGYRHGSVILACCGDHRVLIEQLDTKYRLAAADARAAQAIADHVGSPLPKHLRAVGQ